MHGVTRLGEEGGASWLAVTSQSESGDGRRLGLAAGGIKEGVRLKGGGGGIGWRRRWDQSVSLNEWWVGSVGGGAGWSRCAFGFGNYTHRTTQPIHIRRTTPSSATAERGALAAWWGKGGGRKQPA